ncbi:ABC transporter ATP-binding protein [Alienimonas sp. DA493]|uniref:ABC transporter ATP-binding protein n=1 Tax=Alienimonas sp. DA493 TaxID=3373605 RepID=UPI0037544026
MTEPALSPTASVVRPLGGATPLRVERLTKRFRQGGRAVEALADVSLSVAPGEFVAVMGASGSGKSTLLHLAAGLTPPDGGRVFVEGEELSAMREPRLTRFRRRRIGLVFQAFNLVPTLTALDNVRLPLWTDDARAAGRRAAALLIEMGLADRVDHRPDALSGGEQQRVAIARALVTNPALVLADEPTGSLDSVTGQSICRLLHDLSRTQGRAIVVVTHEPAVACWADRVVILRDGAVRAELTRADYDAVQGLATAYQEHAAAPPPDAAPAAADD